MATLPGWHRFLSAHYVANLGLLVAYLFARTHFLQHGPHETYSRLSTTGDLLGKVRQSA
jgi:hypothetical protein